MPAKKDRRIRNKRQLRGCSAGGARSYVVNGKMTRGFAFLAYPTEYRSLSAMTFIVARGSVVYEKNLGRRTAEIAKAMTSYDRDST